MKWSWKLGRFAGIDVYIHATFWLMLGWFALTDGLAAQSLTAALSAVVFMLALFVCVVLHEYGHALTARRYGIRTRDITLYPIGGVASLERMPDNPKQELWVALAGPAVNVAIAALLYVVMQLTGSWMPLSRLSPTELPFLQQLMFVNISLVVFNLLPAFPMDGGRVVRALLALRFHYVQATNWAANLGKGMAVVFGFVGLFYNPLLLLVAVFVWVAATQEARATQMKYAWGYAPYGYEAYNDFRAQPRYETWTPTDSLIDDEWRSMQARMMELRRRMRGVTNSEEVMAPVVRDGRIVGWVLQRRWL
jgi:Zn-dependent protease